jgi:arylsulfatase A-like enzyme
VEPPRYFSKYDPAAIPVPKLPDNIKALRAAQRGQGLRRYIDDERMLRVMSAIYYGAVAHVDDQVGRLLSELEKQGWADNTLVLFTADHGNMLGDRGRMFKGVMYEGSAHVPLIWRGPKGAPENRGRVEGKIIENTDLLPAILESAGLPIPAGVEGRSFLRLARGQDPNWKDRGYSQLATAMVRTANWKFIDNSRNLSGPFELYDLTSDPKEQRNLLKEPKLKDLVADCKRQLTQWRADKPAPIKIPGMALPRYAQLSDEERRQAIQGVREVRRRRGEM